MRRYFGFGVAVAAGFGVGVAANAGVAVAAGFCAAVAAGVGSVEVLPAGGGDAGSLMITGLPLVLTSLVSVS